MRAAGAGVSVCARSAPRLRSKHDTNQKHRTALYTHGLITRDTCFHSHYRLRQASAFAALLSRAKRVRHGSFLIRSLKNKDSHARLGLSVSTKRVKHAVVRNRIKRLARETFRYHCAELPHKDYLLSYHGPAIPQSDEIAATLKRFWQAEMTRKAYF